MHLKNNPCTMRPSAQRFWPARSLLVPAILLLLTAGGAARAQTVTFFFTAAGSATPITNFVTTGPGQVINLSVYYTAPSTYATNDANVFVGYDKTTTEGTTATPLDGKLGLNGDTGTTGTSAVSNVNATFQPFYFGGQLGGGQSLVTGTRPYGDDLSFGTAAGTSFTSATPTHLFDISIKNLTLSSGSETVAIYDGGTGSEFTSYISDGNTVVRPGVTTLLTVTAAPEPSASVALFIGAALIALNAWRVRLRCRVPCSSE